VIALLALLAVAACGIAATIVALVRDGYGRVPTRSDYDSSRSA